MANEFTKLTEKEVVESVSENGHLFAEDGGKIVRIPAASVGGGGVVMLYATDEYDTVYTDAECTVQMSYDAALACINNPNIVIVYPSRNEYYRPFRVSIGSIGVEFYCVTLDGSGGISFFNLCAVNPDAGPM